MVAASRVLRMDAKSFSVALCRQGSPLNQPREGGDEKPFRADESARNLPGATPPETLLFAEHTLLFDSMGLHLQNLGVRGERGTHGTGHPAAPCHHDGRTFFEPQTPIF